MLETKEETREYTGWLGELQGAEMLKRMNSGLSPTLVHPLQKNTKREADDHEMIRTFASGKSEFI